MSAYTPIFPVSFKTFQNDVKKNVTNAIVYPPEIYVRKCDAVKWTNLVDF